MFSFIANALSASALLRHAHRVPQIAGALMAGALLAGAGSAAQDRAAIEQRELRIVEVSAPEFNCVFDRDCRITVDDFSERFSLPFAQGTGFLQSRQFPVGEKGTRAEGLHAYLYRIDLSQMRNETAARCVNTITLAFDDPVALIYENRRGARDAHIFAVTAGGIGTARPIRATREGKDIQIRFRDLCTAGPNDNAGASSVFFGMTSTSPASTVKARLTDQDGRAVEVLARAALPERPDADLAATNRSPTDVILEAPPVTTSPTGVRVTSPPPRTYEGGTQGTPPQGTTPQATPPSGPTALVSPGDADFVIGFEEYRAEPDGFTITNQYREKYGVRFQPGVSVHRCGGLDTGAMACTYVRAADGTRTAYFDGRSNNGRMVMDFARPVKEVSMRVNATGAKPGEIFTIEMAALLGEQIVGSSREKFEWTFDRATNWPVTARVSVTTAKGATQLTALMRANSRNNQAIRFLFDEIRITYADADTPPGDNTGASPVGAAIFSAEQARADAALGPAEQAAWPAERVAKPSRFRPAPRYRARINWADAEAAVAEQNRLGLRAATLVNPLVLDQAALPVLLPQTADDLIDLAVTRDGNSYSAVFRKDGRHHDYYGSRMLTQINNPTTGAGSAEPVRYFEGETGLSASFTVYGAVYRVTRTCRQESPKLDPDCLDISTMDETIRALIVALGRRAGDRP